MWDNIKWGKLKARDCYIYLLVPNELYQLDFVWTFSENYQQDTTFIYAFLLWYPSFVWKLLSQELWLKELRYRRIIVGKLIWEVWSNMLFLFVCLKKKQDNSLRRSYISTQPVIHVTQCDNILDVECPHIFNGISTSETTIFYIVRPEFLHRQTTLKWKWLVIYPSWPSRTCLCSISPQLMTL